MQFGTLGTEYRYDMTEAKFQTAFAFLKRDDLNTLPDGWIPLENGVRASIQHYETSSEEKLSFETHEKFFDVQYLADGEEFLGVCTRHGLEVSVPYDKENDVTFYREPLISGKVLLRSGDYVVFAPEDAHKPRCAVKDPIPVFKIVVKVPV